MRDTLTPFRDEPSGNPECMSDVLIGKTGYLGRDVNGIGYGVVWRD